MPSPLSDRAFRALPVQIGKYTLLTRLASGGMGEVYVARMSAAAGFEKQVVIKRLLPELARDQQFVQLFLQEARLTARLSHPNICQVFELTAVDEEYLLVMEYLEGFPLSNMIRTYADRGLDLRIATGLVTQACEGLQYAHDFRDDERGVHGIVHRDVSPHNLMLTVSGVVKLLDFGVAKLRREGHHTVTGSAKGKYAYMAPEQLHCEALDARADLFAAGVVLFELIAGKRLFKRRSELATMQAIVEGERPRLHVIRPEVPHQLSDVVHRATSVDRDQRHTSARELAEAIRAAMVTRGGPASLAELSEYVRDHHSVELDEQRMLIRQATGKVPRVALDESGDVVVDDGHGDNDAGDAGDATIILPSDRARATSEQSGKAIRGRLPLRAPTVTRGVDAILEEGFGDATLSDYDEVEPAGAWAPSRAPSRSHSQSGYEAYSDISVDTDMSDSVELDDGLLTVPTPLPIVRADSLSKTPTARVDDSLLDMNLRGKRRSLWLPLAGLLIAVAVALFFWQRASSRSQPGGEASSTVAVAPQDVQTTGQAHGQANGHKAGPDDTAPAAPDDPDDPDRDELAIDDADAGAGDDPAPTDEQAVEPDDGRDSGDEPSKRDRRRKRRNDKKNNPIKDPGFGHLTVDASPYAEIYLDGKKLGITPIVRHKLSAGDHKIKAVSARGTKRVRVTVNKGQITKKRIVF